MLARHRFPVMPIFGIDSIQETHGRRYIIGRTQAAFATTIHFSFIF